MWLGLPQDLIVAIVFKMDLQTVAAIALTCRRYRHIVWHCLQQDRFVLQWLLCGTDILPWSHPVVERLYRADPKRLGSLITREIESDESRVDSSLIQSRFAIRVCHSLFPIVVLFTGNNNNNNNNNSHQQDDDDGVGNSYLLYSDRASSRLNGELNVLLSHQQIKLTTRSSSTIILPSFDLIHTLLSLPMIQKEIQWLLKSRFVNHGHFLWTSALYSWVSLFDRSSPLPCYQTADGLIVGPQQLLDFWIRLPLFHLIERDLLSLRPIANYLRCRDLLVHACALLLLTGHPDLIQPNLIPLYDRLKSTRPQTGVDAKGRGLLRDAYRRLICFAAYQCESTHSVKWTYNARRDMAILQWFRDSPDVSFDLLSLPPGSFVVPSDDDDDDKLTLQLVECWFVTCADALWDQMHNIANVSSSSFAGIASTLVHLSLGTLYHGILSQKRHVLVAHCNEYLHLALQRDELSNQVYWSNDKLEHFFSVLIHFSITDVLQTICRHYATKVTDADQLTRFAIALEGALSSVGQFSYRHTDIIRILLDDSPDHSILSRDRIINDLIKFSCIPEVVTCLKHLFECTRHFAIHFDHWDEADVRNHISTLTKYVLGNDKMNKNHNQLQVLQLYIRHAGPHLVKILQEYPSVKRYLRSRLGALCKHISECRSSETHAFLMQVFTLWQSVQSFEPRRDLTFDPEEQNNEQKNKRQKIE